MFGNGALSLDYNQSENRNNTQSLFLHYFRDTNKMVLYKSSFVLTPWEHSTTAHQGSLEA